MAAWKSGSLADKIKGQAAAPAAPLTPPAPSPAATVVAPHEGSKTAAADRKPQLSPAPQATKTQPKDGVHKNGPATPEPKNVEPAAVEPAPSKEESASPPTPPPAEARAVKDEKEPPKAAHAAKGKAEAKPVDEPPKAASHGPAAVAAVDMVKDEPPVAKAAPTPATGKPEPPASLTNGPASTDPAPAPARPIESDEPLVTLPTNIATLIDKKFSFAGAIAPPPAPVVPIMPQPTKRSVDPSTAPTPFPAPAYGRPTGQIPPNYDTYQQQYAHQGYGAPTAPMYGQGAYQPGYTPNYGYPQQQRGGRGAGGYQTGLFNLPPYERGFRGGGYGQQSYNSYRGNTHYAAPPYYANGYRAPEEAEGPQ